MSSADTARNADAVVERKDGSMVFVEPYETFEAFKEFLDYVRADSHSSAEGRQKPVKYAQTRLSTRFEDAEMAH